MLYFIGVQEVKKMTKKRMVAMSRNLSNFEKMRAKEALLSHDELKRQLKYYPDHGLFIWKIQKGGLYPFSIAGCVNKKNGYHKIVLNGYSYQSHRLAWFYINKIWPSEIIDHEDRNRANFKYSNLRDISHSDNMRNISNKRVGPSGVIGVRVWVNVDGSKRYIPSYNEGKKKQISYGRYSDKALAVYIRHEAEIKHNFILGEKSSASIWLKENGFDNLQKISELKLKWKAEKRASGGIRKKHNQSKDPNPVDVVGVMRVIRKGRKDSYKASLGLRGRSYSKVFPDLYNAVEYRYKLECEHLYPGGNKYSSSYKWLQKNKK